MKVLSTEGLTKLIDLIKSSFISNEDTQATVAVDAVETSEVTLATVATTGAYSDLIDKPDLSGYEQTLNKVTSISSSSTNTQYPSAKCVYDIVGDIETLINAL